MSKTMTSAELDMFWELDKKWGEASNRDSERLAKWAANPTVEYHELELELPKQGMFNSGFFMKVDAEETFREFNDETGELTVTHVHTFYWSDQYKDILRPEVIQWAIDNGLKLPNDI